MKILIDNGHGENTPGKCSPDRRLREYKWAREFASALDRALTARGIDSMRIVTEENDVSISERVRRVNAWCNKLGKQNVLLISIHNNAAGGDGKWHTAWGWQVYCSKNASSNSKRFARLLTAEADKRGLVNPKSKQPEGFWTWSWRSGDIGILKNTVCPAVLTENLFQDNEKEVDYLLSEKGRQELIAVHVAAILEYIKGK